MRMDREREMKIDVLKRIQVREGKGEKERTTDMKKIGQDEQVSRRKSGEEMKKGKEWWIKGKGNGKREKYR